MGLGHMGPGVRATGLRGGKPEDQSVPYPPLRRSPSSSIRKGDPLYGWKNRGRAPGDGFCPSSGGLGSGLYSGPRRPRQAPPPRACLGPTCPTLDYQARFTGFLGSCPGNWKPSLYTRGPRVFPWTLLSAGLPPPQRQSAHVTPGDLGPRRGSGDSASPGGHGLGGRDTRPWMGSPLGTQACARLGG